jgi:hypothetical protein
MAQSVAALGRLITVRQDGKGDFTSSQAAIDAAPPNSLIEIQDNGPYNEKISIGQEGLTIRGKPGCWPIITSVGPVTSFSILVEITAPRVSMERVVLSHAGAAGSAPYCVLGPLSIRSSIVENGHVQMLFRGRNCQIEECFVAGGGKVADATLSVRNTIWIGTLACWSNVQPRLENVLIRGGYEATRATMRLCTAEGILRATDGPTRLTDSIVTSVQSGDPGTVIEHCDVYGNPPFIDEAKPGKGCFSADPQFRDPANLDYRLLPTSPCIGKASDGGDIGCRYTPEMMEMIQKALELRAKGVIKF